MDLLAINQEVFIRRSDGRIHLSKIVKLQANQKLVTVEWKKGNVMQGKEVQLETIMRLNSHIYKAPRHNHSPEIAENAQVSIAPRPTRPQHGRALDVNNYVRPRMEAGAGSFSALVRPTARHHVVPPVDDVVLEVERLRLRRESLHRTNAEARAYQQWCRSIGTDCPNWEIKRMIRMHHMQEREFPTTTDSNKHHQIMVCVRKRPLNRSEIRQSEVDVISVTSEDRLEVHEPRKQVDLTKYLEHHDFRFDHTFDEICNNMKVYEQTARPLVRHIFEGGMATCFAYGQTGSGKTHTMGGKFTGKQQNFRDGIYALSAGDVFNFLKQPNYARLGLRVSCSFFEIYGSRVYDLLKAGKPLLRVLEDGKQQVHVVDLTEEPVSSTSDVLALLERGNSVRTSGQTSVNTKSSRSHAVFQIVLRSGSQRRLHGKFSLIDLAGSERGADNCSPNRIMRQEASEINRSLLALKECIRALGRQSPHLPFRGSKLTQVLRDSFIGGKKVRTCMIAMISPGLRSVEHTLNTLRYADRVKELPPNPIARTHLLPLVDIDSSNIGQTSSMPDIPSQARHLNNAATDGNGQHAVRSMSRPAPANNRNT